MAKKMAANNVASENNGLQLKMAIRRNQLS
jgi:hypothetical protein